MNMPYLYYAHIPQLASFSSLVEHQQVSQNKYPFQIVLNQEAKIHQSQSVNKLTVNKVTISLMTRSH